MIEISSFGAGYQSSCMQVMSDNGLILPKAEYSIFANTGAEPDEVIEYFKYIKSIAKNPIYEVMHKDGLKKGLEDSVKNGSRVASIPCFTKPEEFNYNDLTDTVEVSSGLFLKFSKAEKIQKTYKDENKKGGMLWRQCTTEYKVIPVQKKIKEILGLKKGQKLPTEPVVSLWIGISTDEAQRMKPSRVKYIQHRYPLIELGMSRKDCFDYLINNGYKKPVKSACTFCPYHNDLMWRDLKNNDKKSFNEAVEIDKLIRNGTAKTKDKLYLHRSLKPLDEVDFRTAEDAGQIDMFGMECEGHCGL